MLAPPPRGNPGSATEQGHLLLLNFTSYQKILNIISAMSFYVLIVNLKTIISGHVCLTFFEQKATNFPVKYKLPKILTFPLLIP